MRLWSDQFMYTTGMQILIKSCINIMYVVEIYTLICSFKFIIQPGKTPFFPATCLLYLYFTNVSYDILDGLHVKYPLPIECTTFFLSLLIKLFPCTTVSPYFHLTHWITTFSQFLLRLIPLFPMACTVVSSRIYQWPVVISLAVRG